jgi:Helix-turn-helix domain
MKEIPLTTDQAAPLIGVSPLTLISWRHFGKGPPYLKVGRRALYYASDIEAWLESQVVVPVRKVRAEENGPAR